MDGFLVIARCALSSTVLRLFATREEARAFIGTVRYRGESRNDPVKEGCCTPAVVRDLLQDVGIIAFKGGEPGPYERVAFPAGKRGGRPRGTLGVSAGPGGNPDA